MAFGTCPRPWGITWAVGAADVVFVKLPTSNPITAALILTPDEVQASALAAVHAWVTVAAPGAVDPPPLTVAVVSSHCWVLVGAVSVAASVPTASIVMSPAALVIVRDRAVDAPLALVPLTTGVV